MIRLSHLNKLLIFVIFIISLLCNFSIAEEEPIDIWKKKEIKVGQETQDSREDNLKIKSPILSDDNTRIVSEINEKKIQENRQSVVGIFDPVENNFNLNMWSETDGEDIKKILERIYKLKLSKTSEELLFNVLFTNAYSPQKNLNTENFLNIKIDWLIKKKRIQDLETFLKKNPLAGQNSKAIRFLVDEYLSSADIKSACDKIKFINREVQNNYLEKFTIYCLIHEDRKDEAQLIFDLITERGFKDKFFEDKINFLLGFKESANQKIIDDNLLNFYLSYITSQDFKYEPNNKTNKYIWRYLSSANLIEVNNFEDENIILTYEQAAKNNSFNNDDIFQVYLKMNFNFNQLLNAQQIYKNLANYKARALIYQSTLLTDSEEKKIDLAILLKDLFVKDKLFDIYVDELSNILKSINKDNISSDYKDLVEKNINNKEIKKIKYNNDILHRSKVIRYFLDSNQKINRAEKDFKSIYKKIKKNKKYFVSIKDIIVFESLVADGVSLPKSLDYNPFSTELTIPQNLQDLVNQNQIGLVMLKIVEIVGEDNISDLDPETLYFVNKILNELNLKRIRNIVLSEALPDRT